MNDELRALIEKARRVEMTAEQIEAQRVSFAFGNTNYENAAITRADVVRSSQSLRDAERQSSREN